jgi:hypothetical protein
MREVLPPSIRRRFQSRKHPKTVPAELNAAGRRLHSPAVIELHVVGWHLSGRRRSGLRRSAHHTPQSATVGS